MAYPNSGSMSPPPKPSSQSVPPSQSSAASPPASSAFAPPPAKRQRLSPDARSPTNGASTFSPAASNLSAYGNPYASQNASPAQASFNTPQPHQSAQNNWQSQPSTPGGTGQPNNSSLSQAQSSQMMPPPPRPNKEEKDEKISADDIGDSLFGSGINLKEEENYMHSTFNNRHALDSFTSQTSFGSGSSSANNSFNMLTQGTNYSSQGQDGAFAGTMGSTQSQEDLEMQDRRRRAQAANARNEVLQHHLNDQFLNGNCVRRRMDMRSAQEGVILPTLGLYVRTESETRVAVNGAGTQGVVATKPESMVEQGSPFDHLLSLISLATNERLRSLLVDAYALSRARRLGDHGRVPPDFADIAIGPGRVQQEKVVPESISGTQWDRVADTVEGEKIKQETNEEEGSKSATPQAQSTISFQGGISATLRTIAERDRTAEKERVKRREARRRQAENGTGGDEPTSADTPTADANGADAPVKMTKKEQAKQAKAAATAAESESHTTTNQTAAMMALGKKGNRYSWMSGGAAKMPTNRFAKSTGTSGTSTPGAKSDEATSQTVKAETTSSQSGPRVSDWGSFREDGPGGQGIQDRDWLLVLQRDGREKKALQRALITLGRERRPA